MSVQKSLATVAIHGSHGSSYPGSSLTLDLIMSTSFHLDTDAGFSATSQSDDPAPAYTRRGNPTVNALERRVATLEGGEDAVCFGSGMDAVSALLLPGLSAGDHLLASNVCYAGVAELLHNIVPRFGISVSFVDTSNPDTVSAACTEKPRLIYVETPANPILRLTDIRAVAACARAAGAKLAVDSTLATPVATRPLLLGADYVMHSITKYACGHADTLGGAVIGAHADGSGHSAFRISPPGGRDEPDGSLAD